jgi:hypothetical protein
MYEVICCRDPHKFRYLIDYLSHVVQTTGYPEKRSPVSLFVWGEHGSGKSIVFDHIAKFFGNHGITLSRSEELTGTFNKHLMMGLYVVCEEAVYGKDKKDASTLKDLQTRRTMNVHPKNVDMFTAPNFLRFVFIGNTLDSIPMTVGERRYEVFHVSPHRINDDVWFDRIIEELNEEGGLEAMLYDLRRRKYDVRAVRCLMKENKDRDVSKAQKLDAPIRFALEWIAHGAVILPLNAPLLECKEAPKDATANDATAKDSAAKAAELPERLRRLRGDRQGCLQLHERVNRASSIDVKSAYDQWCDVRLNQFERRDCQRAANQLTKEIRKGLPFIDKYRTDSERGLEFPPLRECLKAVRQMPIESAYLDGLDVEEV